MRAVCRVFAIGATGVPRRMLARQVALASYISLSRATEVVNVLKVAICPQESPDCDRCQPIDGAFPCDAAGRRGSRGGEAQLRV